MSGEALFSSDASGKSLIELLETSVQSARELRDRAREAVLELAGSSGGMSRAVMGPYQTEMHGFAWIAAYVAILDVALNWARELDEDGRLGALEQSLLAVGCAGYLNQIAHGIAMSQDEVVYPSMLGMQDEAARFAASEAVVEMIRRGSMPFARASVITLLEQQGLDALTAAADKDAQLEMVRETFRHFSDERIAPFAREWHEFDRLIPLDTLQEIAELGVFGMTTPEAFGGSEMGNVAMCVVTEELSRGYIGAGSLGTRAEIASDLIRAAGTPEQKAHYLPRIASGEVLATAVFTEPNAGSDLAHLGTRAERHGDKFRVYGSKTWITHAARADLMFLLVRTDSDRADHNGLSMLLVEKPRGTQDDPFPLQGMSGSEIKVLGYRGLKEYEIAFDGLEVPVSQLLGGIEGRGFKQLMSTFELARLQTAARAVGVGQNAFELAFHYAAQRVQFGKPIIQFPRLAGKIAWMAAELTLIRQFVYAVARLKETGVRCDVEAGMAKLVAAKAAWSAADNALQVHGGNGYALEYPISRVLCDARILNIFEGAAEIQAGIVARGLLSGEQNPARYDTLLQ